VFFVLFGFSRVHIGTQLSVRERRRTGPLIEQVAGHHEVFHESEVDKWIAIGGGKPQPKAPVLKTEGGRRGRKPRPIRPSDCEKRSRRLVRESARSNEEIANHESPRTTKLYDRTREELSFEEVERIKI
jgi:hypothetical protein